MVAPHALRVLDVHEGVLAAAPAAAQEVGRGEHHLHQQAVLAREVEAAPKRGERAAPDACHELFRSRAEDEVQALEEAVPSDHGLAVRLRGGEHCDEGLLVESREQGRAGVDIPCGKEALAAPIVHDESGAARRDRGKWQATRTSSSRHYAGAQVVRG